jgi:hypothetical protein
MFVKLIELSASSTEIVVRCGVRDMQFRPVVYLSPERKFLGVGTPPHQNGAAQEVRLFESNEGDINFAALEATLRFVIPRVTGKWAIWPPTIRISIASDLKRELKGFAPAIFYFAARNAGAAKILFA